MALEKQFVTANDHANFKNLEIAVDLSADELITVIKIQTHKI